MHQKATVALYLGLMLLPLVAHSHTRHVPHGACEAAAVAIEELSSDGPRNLFSTSAPGPTSGFLRNLQQVDFSHGWSGQSPEESMFVGLKGALGSSALDCAPAKTVAAVRGVVVGDEEGRAEIARRRFNGTYLFLHYVSLPVLNKSKNLALVAVSTASNQLAGGTRLLLLEKRQGYWRVVGRKILTTA